MLMNKAADFERLDDINLIWTQLAQALEPLGIEFLNYLTVDKDFSAPALLSNIEQIYSDQSPKQDPFLSHCCDSYEITLTGADYLRDYPYLPPEAQIFIQEAERTGFRTGIGIPMRLRGSERFGGFNLGTRMAREAFERQVLPRKEELRLFCLLIHRRIEELSVEEPAPPTSEEAYLIASGLSRKECARLCDISPNTVSEYMKAIYAKLGVNDRVKLARLLQDKDVRPER
ncbi:MAG: LuxR C-terminal-related transcriptional regulator [Pseudomonadota bacterium]